MRPVAQDPEEEGAEDSDSLNVGTVHGQQQLIRGQIQNELNLSSKIDSNTLACAVDNFNKSIMVDIHAHYRNPELPYPREESRTQT